MAEVVVDLVGEAKNFPGIENVFGIKGALDFAHHIEQRVAELVAHVFGARNSDSVLGRNRTLELAHERGSLIGDQSEFS